LTNQTEKPLVQAVIFDLGGVILRTDDPTSRTQLAESLGLSRWQLEEIVFGNPVALKAEEGLATLEEVWAEITRRLNLSDEAALKIDQGFFGGDEVDFRLVNILRRLKAAGFKTALLSNTWHRNLERYIFQLLKFPEDTFDAVISSAYYGAAKPKTEIYKIAVEALSVRPQEAVFVDDNARNIEGALAAGLNVITFKTYEQTCKELVNILPIEAAGLFES
jgi:glucose-1-phosphatase